MFNYFVASQLLSIYFPSFFAFPSSLQNATALTYQKLYSALINTFQLRGKEVHIRSLANFLSKFILR